VDDAALESRGFTVVRGAVPAAAVERALRHLHLDLVRNGLPSETLGSWLWSAHWFPHLKWDEEIVQLAEHLPADLREGELCDPQIVLQPPDADPDQEITPHVDEEPEWADGRRYLRVLGVPLSGMRATNGGLVVWPPGGGDPVPVEAEPGDVVVMHPKAPHSSGLNREGGIRYVVYFRYVEART
jgi:Phytanoyl-CoA dioxygenase (PhyH)